MSVLQGLVLVQRVYRHRIAELLADLADLPAKRYKHTSLLGRIRELRHNFTAYNAAYIALAEATEGYSLHKGSKADQRPSGAGQVVCRSW